MVAPKKAVGYTRVSDDSQAEQDRTSLPEQERAIREHCTRKGYDLVEVFSDIGKRWDANRPEFRRMLNWGQECPCPYDVIVVWRADRIVGSASTAAALEPLLDQGGVDIEGVTEVVSKQWLLLNALIAKGETEAKRHRGKMGVRTAVERGHYPGLPPYGRRLDKELRQVLIDESEALWYREMFAWSIAGDGDAKIAERLNDLGIPTRRQGKVTRTGRITGKGWTVSYIAKILKNPASYGEGKVQIKGGDSYDFKLPPVVDKQTFEQAMKARQSRQHFGQRATNRLYLISPRKGRCVECGQRFRLESRSYQVKKKTRDGEVRAYERKTLSPALICRGMHVYPHIYRCRKAKYIDFDHVQTTILHRVSEVLSSDDFALACAMPMPDSDEVDGMATRVDEAREAVEQTTNEISFVVTKGRTGQIPESVFDMHMAQLNRVLEFRQARLKEIETDYHNSRDKQRNLKQVMPLVNALKDFWETFKNVTICSNTRIKDDGLVDMPVDSDGMEHLRNMLNMLVDNFTINRRNNITVELSIPVLDGIAADALRCRQLTNSPSP